MLTIFWTLTLGPDEPIPAFWRDRHPDNLPALPAGQLSKAREEQRIRLEATSRARREVRRVLGVSRREATVTQEQWRPVEAFDTLLLNHLLGYPFHALRLRFYASPQQLGSRLSSPVACVQELDRARQRTGTWRLWSGSAAELLYVVGTGVTGLVMGEWRAAYRQSTKTTWLEHARMWFISLGLEAATFLACLPFYRAYIHRAVLASVSTEQLGSASGQLAGTLAQGASIHNQLRLLGSALRHPLRSGVYWTQAFPVGLLHSCLATQLTDWLMRLARPSMERAEATVVSHFGGNHGRGRSELAENVSRRRRRLWRSCAWSSVYVSATLLTRALLVPLEALACRLVLGGVESRGMLSSGVGNAFMAAMQLAGSQASWTGLLCECAIAFVVVQVDWLVCRQMMVWQSANNSATVATPIIATANGSNNGVVTSAAAVTEGRLAAEADTTASASASTTANAITTALAALPAVSVSVAVPAPASASRALSRHASFTDLNVPRSPLPSRRTLP
ncbi:hypothetical protein THASP1DRAFT_28484 [Thamnocephalis sphaerospora]|uniref:Uncharacterized protein n=1 Tax=Thamnocephalis sphaerospora TaxID=78915 RepID=A0A4P9XU22_9FUNG|nr:hypothetical protein THASP1DRAFT_28484 [Thamnocephalis sphaerospora]|eukprot:RKP09714.1 hypothetical protein THASP1DRAFT_28484 [Thamnocephalis sphaerospora]